MAQSGYTVPFMLAHAGKYRTEDKLKIHTIHTQETQPGTSKQRKTKTSVVQSLLTTLGQETRWAYCAMLLSPHVAVTSQQPVCVVEPVAWLKDNATCTHCPSGFETSRTKMAHRGDMHYTEGYTIYMFRATTVSR